MQRFASQAAIATGDVTFAPAAVAAAAAALCRPAGANCIAAVADLPSWWEDVERVESDGALAPILVALSTHTRKGEQVIDGDKNSAKQQQLRIQYRCIQLG